MERPADQSCVDRRLGEALTSYCFGRLSDAERQAVEAHLLDCDACWAEFQSLDAAVRALRLDAAIRPAMPVKEAASLLGMSSRLDRPFAGHIVFACATAAFYGVEWVLALWSELGYSYDRFGTLAWTLSAPVGAWVFGTVMLALWLDSKAAKAGRTNGLRQAAVVMCCALSALVAFLTMVLPGEPTILASFQTRTASVGYFKDAVVLFLPLLLFIVPPFHAVTRFQQELRAGRATVIVDFLAHRPDALPPRGLWFLSPQFLTGFFVVSALIKILGTTYMLDALTPGPYAQLFSAVAYASTGIWLALAGSCVAWYSNALNDIRREGIALRDVSRRNDRGQPH